MEQTDSDSDESKVPLIAPAPGAPLNSSESSRRPFLVKAFRAETSTGFFKLLLGIVIGFVLAQVVKLLPNEFVLDESVCASLLSTYSPVLEAVEYFEYEWPNGFDEKDKYRGPPTPERDAAWFALWEMGDTIIRMSDLPRLNKTTSTTAKLFRPELNGIAANLEVFHQLHCLDMIRRYTYLDVYTNETLPADFRDVPARYLREHVDHCITTLRLAITCTGDVTPILLERDPESTEDVLPDLRTTHKCRNFERIQEWFIENSYTDWDCIQRGGIGCDIIPARYQRTNGNQKVVDT